MLNKPQKMRRAVGVQRYYQRGENELQIFQNAEFGSVRTAIIGGETFFVGKDVAKILGYSNPRKALADHVDNEDKLDGVTIRDSLGRDQTPVFINESGLYSLIFRSHLPKAHQFKHWVTSEVLPMIRKNGMYTIKDILDDPDFAIAALQELKAEREKKQRISVPSSLYDPQYVFVP